MMPPPRRFSAAPTLTCPHRNKSSHSSSSLHHTYSIDSSESMITVIPANGGAGANLRAQQQQQQQQETKRSPRGSSILTDITTTGASFNFTNNISSNPSNTANRSPLSPRSPNRCLSPGLLTPASELQETGPQSPCWSPALTTQTTATTCSSLTGQTAVVQRHQRQQAIIPTIDADDCGHDHPSMLMPSHAGSEMIDSLPDADSSLAVENGTSFSSSRMELDEGELTDASDSEHELADPPELAGDPNKPTVCETINDFCARHSQEEFEQLVELVGGLKISECYFSERSSTVCVVIQVNDHDDEQPGANRHLGYTSAS